MLEYQINVARFNETFPPELRRGVASRIGDANRRDWTEAFRTFHDKYWGIIGKAFNRYEPLPKEIPIIDDLSPVNIAVLDWLLEMDFDKGTVIADIPCGLGNLMFYLREMGFPEIWGYDNWSQIERERAVHFLTLCGMQAHLVDLPTILEKPVDILACIGLYFDWISPSIVPLIAKSKYVLVDTSYLPINGIEGFEVIGCYPRLLSVYERKDCNERLAASVDVVSNFQKDRSCSEHDTKLWEVSQVSQSSLSHC